MSEREPCGNDECDGLGPCGNRDCHACSRLARLVLFLGWGAIVCIAVFALLAGVVIGRAAAPQSACPTAEAAP